MADYGVGLPKVNVAAWKPPNINVSVGKVGGYGGGFTLQPATDKTLGGIKVGDALTITEDGVLSVVRTDAVEQDNTLPVTSAAVYAEIGNIAALLSTI